MSGQVEPPPALRFVVCPAITRHPTARSAQTGNPCVARVLGGSGGACMEGFLGTDKEVLVGGGEVVR